MKRMVAGIVGMAIIILATPIYSQGGIPYIYEKVSDSEFYTYKTTPVEGMMEFSETVFPPYGQYMMEAFIRNNSARTIDFKGAKYTAVTYTGDIYYLQFEEVEANTGVRGSLLLKAGDIIIVYCRSPVRNDNVREIFIQLTGEDRVHFVPYKRLGEFVESPEQHLKNLLSGLMDIFKFRMPRR